MMLPNYLPTTTILMINICVMIKRLYNRVISMMSFHSYYSIILFEIRVCFGVPIFVVPSHSWETPPSHTALWVRLRGPDVPRVGEVINTTSSHPLP